MKKEYVRPVAVEKSFAANEYIAACYKIKCTTPNNNSSYTKLVDDTNGNGVYDSGDEVLVASYFTGCGKWHKGVIRDTAPAANGFVVRTENVGSFWNPEIKEVAESVFWWHESLGGHTVDYHVMTPGDENYLSNPNAS